MPFRVTKSLICSKNSFLCQRIQFCLINPILLTHITVGAPAFVNTILYYKILYAIVHENILSQMK